jgi:hypothetical protein
MTSQNGWIGPANQATASAEGLASCHGMKKAPGEGRLSEKAFG